ncbi:MAG: sigma 54-interacting transcriptional regulator, partial [candidate division Zixibacteria bacterium]|nr:sigma 54-interacting transcriptional regulator [candidate division Zixibacteria bacterium]
MDKTLGKCLHIAGELLRQRKFDDALKILVTVSVGLLSPAQKALYSLLLADARLNKGYTDVDKSLELALAYYSAGADNLKYALAMYLHGWHLQSLGNLPAAKEALMGAYLNFKRCNDSTGQALALCRLSSVQVHVGDFQGAITHLKRCCEVYQSIGEEKAAIAMSSNAATIYVSVGNIREAISQYESLAPAICKVGSKDIAIYFTVSAIPHALLGDTRKAEDIISKALPYLDTLPRDRAIYYEYLGTIHLLEEDYAAAEKALLQGLGISLDIAPESALVSQIKRRLGDACLGLGRLDSAKRYTEEGLAVAEKLNERAEIAACWRILAQLEHHYGHVEKARDWFDRAIDLFNRIGSMYELAATRYMAATSGLFGEGGRQALLYLAREYFEKEAVRPYLEKIDREMKTVAEPEIPRPKTDGSEPPLVITVNPAMAKNLETARNIASSDMAILLTGPSGVGKDLLAKY